MILPWSTGAVLVVLAIASSMSWTRVRGAPWVPTPLEKVHRLLELSEITPEDTVYDLGCGDGRIVVMAARRFGAKAVGIEIDPLRFFWCQALITILGLRDKVRILYGDFFSHDLSRATLVTCYLLPKTNIKLQEKLRVELPSRARIVSSAFVFPAFRLVKLDENHKIFLYRIRESEGGENDRP